jgi:hypothetical protein
MDEDVIQDKKTGLKKEKSKKLSEKLLKIVTLFGIHMSLKDGHKRTCWDISSINEKKI